MKVFFASTAALLALAGSANAAVIDGSVSPGEYSLMLAVQDTPTGFGDNFSELDAAYANIMPDGAIELALTGNLEGNGNGLIIFMDTRDGGAVANILAGGYGELGEFGGARVDDWGNDIDGDFGVTHPAGGPSILDPGFDPDFAIEINTDGSTYWTNIIDMTVPNSPDQPTRDVFLGANAVNGGGTTQAYSVNGGDVTHAFDNTNVDGVWGYDWGNPPGQLGDPLSATTGFEFLFSAAFLNADPGHEIKILPFITSGDGGYLSNQFLPGLNGAENLGGPGGLGGTPLFDAREFDGDQFLVVPTPGTLAMFGLAGIAALRRRR